MNEKRLKVIREIEAEGVRIRDEERMINDAEIAHLDKIFAMPLKTEEDFMRLVELTEEGEELEEGK